MSKLSWIGILLLCMFSCIEPFQPEINDTVELLVINGNITDRPGWHFVEVSRSSPLYEPDFIPETGCVVRVEDEFGQGVTYAETRPGIYGANLDESFLDVNKAFRLFVFTPDGKEYQSDYDSLLECPPVDAVYYSKEKQETENSSITYYGLRFFLDVIGKAGDSRNFLWKLEETYEYQSRAKFDFSWVNDSLRFFESGNDSLLSCYTTRQVPGLYTASTRYLIANELHGFPLNYVSNQTPRLGIAYGLLVTQYSLSDDAFLYWDKMRSQLSETGGLYDKQPSGSAGNIQNVNDGEEQVLGYFYCSQVKKNSVLFKNKSDFSVRSLSYQCDTLFSKPEEPPMDMDYNYLFGIGEDGDEVTPPFLTGIYCLNCEDWGGSLVPPDYWNDHE